MPTSAKIFDKEVKELLREYISKGMTKFLDVGAGSGKYGDMLNSLRTWEKNDFLMDAVEPDSDYRNDYNLHEIYNYVHSDSIESFVNIYPTYCANVVIFGDVLEHLPKAVGISVLEFFIYRCNYIIAITPKYVVQFSKKHLQESHNSIWHPGVFEIYHGRVTEKNNKVLAVIPGFFNYPDAVISKSSYEIMKEQGCTRFRGTIMDRG